MNPGAPLRGALRSRLLGEALPEAAPTAPPSTDGDPVLADVVRAAAHLARPFTADELGELVGRTPLEVLLALQRGADRGLRVEEHGDRLRVRIVTTRPPLAALRSAWEEQLRPATSPAEPVSAPAEEPPEEPSTAALDLTGQVESAREAFRNGDANAALTRGAGALAALEGRTDAPARLLRLQLLSDCATYLSRTGSEQALPRALQLAKHALADLKPEDPIALQVGARISLGAVAAEVGTDAAIDEAIDVLTEAARLLQDSGRGVDGARLLNDLAELWMRRGDPVRAAHLLRSSRQAFEKHTASDPRAAFELAETDHLLARLALHARARPEAGEALWEAARTHALSAVRGFHRLQRTWEEGRALETLGRLQIRHGELDEALQALQGALTIQRRLEDLNGLARTTNALAQTLASAGRPGEALALLEESVELDLHIGSTAGLHHNAADVTGLAPLVSSDPHLAARHEQLRARIAGALGTLER